VFGPGYVGAIHGRLLTAWSAAGLIGPEIVNDLRQSQLAAGVARENIYDKAMLVLAGLLVAGLICDLAVRPVAPRWFTSKPAAAVAAVPGGGAPTVVAQSRFGAAAVLPWLAVGLPLLWGFWQTVQKAAVLFR
jgi:hypothetical protein